MLVKKNDVVTFHFTTHRFDTGAAADADSTPTATAYEDNGSADIGGCTVTKIATGHYRVDVDTSDADFEAGKFYNIAVAATVNGVAAKGAAGTFYCVSDDPETIAQTGDAMLVTSGTGTGQISLAAGLVRLSAAGVDDILDEIVEGAITLRQVSRLILALAAKVSGGGTATITFRDSGDTKNRITMTVDADGNRSAVTLDLT